MQADLKLWPFKAGVCAAQHLTGICFTPCPQLLWAKGPGPVCDQALVSLGLELELGLQAIFSCLLHPVPMERSYPMGQQMTSL